ncbi:prevent-host-death protein [Candidatus Peregrinibacteria bacterium]|nr:prevent-host-death protein [Candidatus Peregrinibacteria bacterium]
MNNTLTAQDLKIKGMAALAEKTKEDNEAFITIRGEKSFVVLTLDKYNYFRECELDAALRESENDLATGKYSVKSLKSHIKDLNNV